MRVCTHSNAVVGVGVWGGGVDVWIAAVCVCCIIWLRVGSSDYERKPYWAPTYCWQPGIHECLSPLSLTVSASPFLRKRSHDEYDMSFSCNFSFPTWVIFSSPVAVATSFYPRISACGSRPRDIFFRRGESHRDIDGTNPKIHFILCFQDEKSDYQERNEIFLLFSGGILNLILFWKEIFSRPLMLLLLATSSHLLPPCVPTSPPLASFSPQEHHLSFFPLICPAAILWIPHTRLSRLL